MGYHRAKDRMLLLFVARRTYWSLGRRYRVAPLPLNVVLGTSFVNAVRYTGASVVSVKDLRQRF
jgi:hypothetical protein